MDGLKEVELRTCKSIPDRVPLGLVENYTSLIPCEAAQKVSFKLYSIQAYPPVSQVGRVLQVGVVLGPPLPPGSASDSMAIVLEKIPSPKSIG